MIYYIQEIALYMLGAYLIGAVYGWFLRSIRASHDQKQIQDGYANQINQLRSENQALQDQLLALQKRVAELEEIPPSGAGENWSSEYSLEVISDIEKPVLKRLADEKIHTTRDLLAICDSEESVYALAEKVRVEDFAIARWVSIAQLLKVADIDVETAELLEATEIYSLEDLSRQRSGRLLEKLAKTTQRLGLDVVLPSETVVQGWIEHASHLQQLQAE